MPVEEVVWFDAPSWTIAPVPLPVPTTMLPPRAAAPPVFARMSLPWLTLRSPVKVLAVLPLKVMLAEPALVKDVPAALSPMAPEKVVATELVMVLLLVRVASPVKVKVKALDPEIFTSPTMASWLATVGPRWPGESAQTEPGREQDWPRRRHCRG